MNLVGSLVTLWGLQNLVGNMLNYILLRSMSEFAQMFVITSSGTSISNWAGPAMCPWNPDVLV